MKRFLTHASARSYLLASICWGLSSWTVVPAAHAVDLPLGFVVEDAFPSASFVQPVQVVFLPDGRKLVVELPGKVWTVLPSGLKWPVPFIDLTDEIRSHHDLGMIGCAIDPDFPENKWVYLGYVVDPGNPSPDDDQFCRLTRYKFSSTSPNVANLSTRQVLLGETWTEGIPTLTFSHAIGALRFAPDKSLLVAAGDGAQFNFTDPGGFDPNAFGPGKTDPAEDMGAFRARSLDSIAGKILRIDKETGFGLDSNPYWDGDPTSDRSRIWAYGLRNPYRFCVRPGTGSKDPAEGDPGVLYVGDVGWFTYEEFNIIPEGGMNFGWPCQEGIFAQPLYQSVDETAAGNDSILCSAPSNPENPAPVTPPALRWHHTNGNFSFPVGWEGSTAVGGVFYTGTSYPSAYHGLYFLGDYVQGWIRTVEVDENDNVIGWGDFATNADGPVDIEADPVTGDIYYVSIFTNEIRRIRFEGSAGIGEHTGTTIIVTTSHPNPFHSSVTIDFGLSGANDASVQVFSADGQLVRTLGAAHYEAGRHSLVWDGRDDAGNQVGRGVYFYQIRAGGSDQCRKIVLQ